MGEKCPERVCFVYFGVVLLDVSGQDSYTFPPCFSSLGSKLAVYGTRRLPAINATALGFFW
jgi:hypothetical protein